MIILVINLCFLFGFGTVRHAAAVLRRPVAGHVKERKRHEPETDYRDQVVKASVNRFQIEFCI